MDDADPRTADPYPPQRLRALAHPLRWRLLDVLDREPQATATRCAEVTGESVASCSYHLRILAKYGYIEAVPGPGRERPWRLTSRRQELSRGTTPEEQRASQAAIDAFLEHELARLRAWWSQLAGQPGEWRDASGGGGATTYLTADELASLRDELLALITRYDERDGAGPEDRPEGAREVRLFFSAMASPGT